MVFFLSRFNYITATIKLNISHSLTRARAFFLTLHPIERVDYCLANNYINPVYCYIIKALNTDWRQKAMTVNIHIHVTHRQHTDGQETIKADGATVGEALDDFILRYPGMKKEIFDDKGELRHYIEIYLNGESAYPGELERAVKDGDDIQIITFLAGG